MLIVAQRSKTSLGPVAVVEASSWGEAKEICTPLALWAFRGQRQADWNLETSLHRHAIGTDYDFAYLRNRENWMLHNFRRFAHGYLSLLPPDDSLLEWLSIIQHYGGPTRLLDFTHSFYIASFFAIERSYTDAAVWCIDLGALDLRNSVRLRFNNNGSIDEIRAKNTSKCEKMLKNPRVSQCVLPAEPYLMHQRMWLHQGLFLVPLQISSSFEVNLAASLGLKSTTFRAQPEEWTENVLDRCCREPYDDGKVSVLKVILNRSLHKDILQDLGAMNITAASLFPGLDGYARSLYYHLTYDPELKEFRELMSQRAKQGR
jgi:hypothetical protein